MAKLSISKAWDETAAFITRETRLLVPLALALLFLPPVIASFVAPRATPEELAKPGIFLVIILVQMLIGAVGQIAISRLALGYREQIGASLGLAARRLPAFIGSFVIVALPILFLLGMSAGLQRAFAVQGNSSGAIVFGVLTLVFMVVMLVIFARFTLNTAIAAVEPGGPIVLAKRGFALTRGQALRLLGAALLILIGGSIATYALTIIVGSLVTLALGPPDPWTVSSLIIAVVGAAAQAALLVVFTVLFARLYAQRVSDLGLPSNAT